MKLTKIHNVLKFKQSDWMKKYINFNTKKGTNASNSFEKDFFKLMINSIYGKKMENLRKRIDVRIANNEKKILKYTSRPTDITHKIFHKDYAAIYETKAVLTFSKPIYVGFTVLELSKWFMYDFHCNFIKKHFDTDSIPFKIKSNVYEEFFTHKHSFDFSNYPKDWKFFDQTNKKVIDKMKDVSEGKIIDEFVGLKSEIHSMKNTLDSSISNSFISNCTRF